MLYVYILYTNSIIIILFEYWYTYWQTPDWTTMSLNLRIKEALAYTAIEDRADRNVSVRILDWVAILKYM